MKKHFLCSVSLNKPSSEGVVVKQKEVYVIPAETYTEAEAAFYKYIEAFSNEFEKLRIKIFNISEYLKDFDGYYWYVVKLGFITLNEKTGAEKTINSNVLLKADDPSEVLANIRKAMEASLAGYRVLEVKETPIVDYIEDESSDDIEMPKDE